MTNADKKNEGEDAWLRLWKKTGVWIHHMATDIIMLLIKNSTDISRRCLKSSMLFTHKGQGMFSCQAAHLVWANVCLLRCSACVSWRVIHQLPKQLPKLHLMPIKPVSLPLLPDCMCNIKKSYLIFQHTGWHLRKKSSGIADVLCLPKAVVFVNSMSLKMCPREWEKTGFSMQAIRESLQKKKKVTYLISSELAHLPSQASYNRLIK